ncbi:MAG: hypothetical protein AAFR61_20215 [Bacteroidota bacterium]
MRKSTLWLARGMGVWALSCLLFLSAQGQTRYGLTAGLQIPTGQMGDFFALGLGLDVRYRYEASQALAFGAGIGIYRFDGNFQYEGLVLSTIPAYLGAEYRFFRKALGNTGLNLILAGGLDGGMFVSGGNVTGGTYSSELGLLMAPRFACILEFSGVELLAELRPVLAIPRGHSYLGLNLGILL